VERDESAAARRGVDRRTLIKGAAAAGVGVWTAPVILDSLSSPAAAGSVTGCQRIHLEVNPFPILGNCNALPTSSSAWATSCDSTFPSLSTVCGTTLANLPTTVDTLANLGITRTSCDLLHTTLTLSKTTCSWVAGVAHSTLTGCHASNGIHNDTAGSRTISFPVGLLVDDYYLVITCT
jgi:hypothetical protein